MSLCNKHIAQVFHSKDNIMYLYTCSSEPEVRLGRAG